MNQKVRKLIDTDPKIFRLIPFEVNDDDDDHLDGVQNIHINTE